MLKKTHTILVFIYYRPRPRIFGYSGPGPSVLRPRPTTPRLSACFIFVFTLSLTTDICCLKTCWPFLVGLYETAQCTLYILLRVQAPSWVFDPLDLAFVH